MKTELTSYKDFRSGDVMIGDQGEIRSIKRVLFVMSGGTVIIHFKKMYPDHQVDIVEYPADGQAKRLIEF
jgi:hypothetical protein